MIQRTKPRLDECHAFIDDANARHPIKWCSHTWHPLTSQFIQCQHWQPGHRRRLVQHCRRTFMIRWTHDGWWFEQCWRPLMTWYIIWDGIWPALIRSSKQSCAQRRIHPRLWKNNIQNCCKKNVFLFFLLNPEIHISTTQNSSILRIGTRFNKRVPEKRVPVLQP